MSIKLLITGSMVLSVAMATPTFAQENLTAEAAGKAGTTYLMMSHLAEAVSEAGVAELQIQAGQTLTNTLINVAEGKTDVGVVPLILPFLLKHGRGPYSKQGAEVGAKLISDVRALYPHNLGAFYLFAYESSGITGYDQLKGKTIYNGPPRGGALINARQVLQVVTGMKDGEGYTGLQVNWGQMLKTISDSSADAMVLPMTFPSPALISSLAAGNINVISVPKDIFEGEAFTRLTAAPGGAPVVIAIEDMGYGEGVKVISEDGKFRALVTTGAEIVNKNMSFDLAKSITAAYIAALDKLKAKTPFAKNLGIDDLDAVKTGFCGPNPIQYHLGAIAAWEAAGYKVPDCAKSKS